MSDFLIIIFGPSNLIASFILSFCLLYWLIVIIGIIDMDMIDVDLDIDAEAEMDMSGGSESGVAWFNRVLHFFNLGRIPFMIWLSVVGGLAWIGVILVNFMLGIDSFIVGTALYLIAFIGAMVIAKPLTFPLVKMFDALEKNDGLKSVIGKIGEVIYPDKNGIPGEAEINHEGSRIRIFVLPANKEVNLIRNKKVLVISPTENDPNIFIVEPYE